METVKRKVSISQLDEIWERAKKEWGDPGLRHPPPDIRFESLRGLLNEIEEIFGANKTEGFDSMVGQDVSVRKSPRPLKKASRKIFRPEDEDDEEIPF